MNLTTERARLAYAFSEIEKTSIPDEIFYELVSDFQKTHEDVAVQKTVKNPEPFGWNVFAKAEVESMSLYEDWTRTFADHGYEPPFLTLNMEV